MLAAEDLRPAGLALHSAAAGEVVRHQVAVEVLQVALEAALGARRVVALRACVLEVRVHVRVEVLLRVACNRRTRTPLLHRFFFLTFFFQTFFFQQFISGGGGGLNVFSTFFIGE